MTADDYVFTYELRSAVEQNESGRKFGDVLRVFRNYAAAAFYTRGTRTSA
jgi:hypothetical protein